MTTTPMRPATAWPGLDTIPSGLRTDVSARVARRLFRAAVTRLPVTVREGSDSTRTWGPADRRCGSSDPTEFYARVGRDGLIGFGEAYLTGAWDTDDLGGFLTVLAAKLPTLIPAPLQTLRAAYVRRPPRAHKNTQGNTRQNISHHYDLSNDLFKLFLDETLNYSSALYDTSLTDRGDHLAGRAARGSRQRVPGRGAAAQDRPVARPDARRRGHPRPRDRHRLGRAGHPRSRTRRHRALGDAVQRAARAGRATHRRGGVRRPGHPRAERLPRRAGQLRRHRLRGDDRGGRPRVLVDVLPDDRPPARSRRPRRHPGDHDAARPDAGDQEHLHLDQQVHLPRRLPALGARRSTRSPGPTPPCGSAIGCRSAPHYAQTLQRWDDAFLAARDEVRALGFDETFRRMWHFYLDYSRAGFASGYIDVQQITLHREP